jgi:hypothetical protein
MRTRNGWIFLFALSATLWSCGKEEEQPEVSGPKIIFRFAFDPEQERLNNFGQAAAVPAGHAAQSPVFHSISAHYFELTPQALTQLGQGQVLYHAPETTAGGSTAIDFSKSLLRGAGEDYLSVPIASLAPGSYEYVRVSLAYQNYDIQVRHAGMNLTGRIASFVGYRSFISRYRINTQEVLVNGNRDQGYWGVEVDALGTPYVLTGQAPQGATTVPNPIQATSPIPAGSCVVTGKFDSPLILTGNETEDIVITLSLSTNHSFEWAEVNEDGLYEPSAGEWVVDMGLRGLVPRIN